jgi:outer membrane protein TolC
VAARPQERPDTLPDLSKRGASPGPARDSSGGDKQGPAKKGSADPLLDAPPYSGATPVIPEPVQECPVDLPAVLARAGVENPTIAIAQAEIRVALAAQLEARSLLLPSLNAGANYHWHEGTLQASFGGLRRTNGENSLYFGFGARTVAAETVTIPGLRFFAPLADAIFNPRAARDEVAARRYAATATRNNILLDVSTAYLNLLAAEGRLAVIRESERNIGEVVDLTVAHYRSGLGRRGDADRALSEAALFHRDAQAAEEEVAVTAARLAELLNLDPSVRLRTQDGPVQLFDLVNLNDPLEELIQVAVRNRPEMGQWSATIAATEVRLRQEQVRPFLPTLLVGFSAGGFGGGSNQVGYHMGKFGGRTDFDVLAYWTFQNFGLGNLANARRRRAEVGEAESERVIALNRVRDEVAEAYATSGARRRDVEVAKRQLATAQNGFRRDMEAARALVAEERPEGGVRRARPIEVLQSARLLAAARQELLLAVIRYDEAQFRLFVALGQPPDLAAPGGRDKAGCPH